MNILDCPFTPEFNVGIGFGIGTALTIIVAVIIASIFNHYKRGKGK